MGLNKRNSDIVQIFFMATLVLIIMSVFRSQLLQEFLIIIIWYKNQKVVSAWIYFDFLERLIYIKLNNFSFSKYI